MLGGHAAVFLGNSWPKEQGSWFVIGWPWLRMLWLILNEQVPNPWDSVKLKNVFFSENQLGILSASFPCMRAAIFTNFV